MLDSMDVGALIKALGGTTVVAGAVGLSVQAVGNWTMRNAIPGEHHLAVWRLATVKKVDWTPPQAEGLVLAPAGELKCPALKPSPPTPRRKRPPPAAPAAVEPRPKDKPPLVSAAEAAE